MPDMFTLWGSDFEVSDTQSVIAKVKKSSTPKKPKVVTEKSLSSKKKKNDIPIEDRLGLINQEVNRVLGVFKNEIMVVDNYDKLVDYIDKSIENKIVAIDTETNNSLVPLECKLMGPCLYTPGLKPCYIPVNHRNFLTQERLSWQVTEKQIKEQLDRLHNHNVLNVYHNAKFDWQVIYDTCDCDLDIYWDTLIGTRMLNENEKDAGLKAQYIDKIDSSIEHYDIEHLFKNVQYADVDPYVFALYAARDPKMTFDLFEYQKEMFESKSQLSDEKGQNSVYNCFMNIEMPFVKVVAHMENKGVGIDEEYSKELSNKYHAEYDVLQNELLELLKTYEDEVNKWRLTDVATYRRRKYFKDWISEQEKEACCKLPQETIDKQKTKYTNYDSVKKDYYKESKSKSEQLVNPLNLDAVTSPIQLAILLYDVLGCEPGILDSERDKRQPNYVPSRSTGGDVLEALNEKYDIPILKKIVSNREFSKLISTYIDNIPNVVLSDKRVHTHFNQLGAGTGRTSSSEPVNLQNIPSHNHLVRPMFKSQPKYHTEYVNDNFLTLRNFFVVPTTNGEKYVKDLVVGDILVGNDNDYAQIDNIEVISESERKIYIV